MAKETQQRLFGGHWTQEKLEKLEKYLRAYTRIFEKNRRAAYFETTYVDAFAGTGTLPAPGLRGGMFPELSEGVEDYQKGSVRRALEVDPQFDHYVFIEKDKKRFKELEEIKRQFRSRDIRVANEDANEFLRDWCRKFDSSKSRAVVFLDPFGANVDWDVIKQPLIGRVGKVNLEGIHWVIVGGESGPRARKMEVEWVEDVFRQCRAASVPFFFKQWGGVRKDLTGRLLHDRTYDEMPTQIAS